MEFALVATLFFGVIFTGLDFGYAFTIRENMIHAAQEGLRQAVVNGSSDSSRDEIATSQVYQRMISVVGASRAAQPQSATDCVQNPSDPVPPNPDDPTAQQIPTSTAGALRSCTSFGACLDSSGNPISNTKCMTVYVKYDYGDNSIAGFAPPFMAKTINVSATQRLQ